MVDDDTPSMTGPIGKDDEYTGPVLPAIGLTDLPPLPTTELAIAEQKFVFEGFAEIVDPPVSRAELREKVDAALLRFKMRPTFDQAALSAVSSLGLLALRPERIESDVHLTPRAIVRARETLRSLVWQSVERWRDQVEFSLDLEERQGAARNLKSFGELLVPDARGKRRAAALPEQIVLSYRILLFRLRLALVQLDAAPDASAASVERVARESGLTLEHLRDWLFRSESWVRHAKPYTADQMARKLVAEMAEISPEAVANIMSRAKKRPPRSPGPDESSGEDMA